jgi:prephenate dehydrogenase
MVSDMLGDDAMLFIGGHPLCGSEATGISGANPNLFCNQYVVLCPHPESTDEHAKSMAALSACWQQLGAKITQRLPQEHDAILACTSHLPHLASYALMNALDEGTSELHLSGGSLRDATRIASANPELWTEISMANKDHLLKALELYIGHLQQSADLLRNQDDDKLQSLYARAQQIRKNLEATKH